MDEQIPSTPTSFEEASKELESIITTIEGGNTPVDQLIEKVERAAVLIKFCREKITSTEENVQKVVDSLTEKGADSEL